MRSANAVEELTRQLEQRLGADRVSRQDAQAYSDAVTLWNGAVTARPALVVRPRSSAEVATTVTAARESGAAVSVRGGGHDWAGRALRDGGVVIDLSAMREVRIAQDVAIAEGGSLAGDVVAAAAQHGANVATGTAGLVGMAGLTLGGGYGLLLGTAGLAADNLLGAEVVLADGRLVSTDEDPELLWALRGGGGNFGVVTQLRIRTHADRGLVGGMVLFPWNEAETVLARYSELIEGAPDGLTVLLELSVVPEIGPCLLAVPVWSGERQGADAALADVGKLGTPINTAVGPATQRDLLAQFDQAVPTGMHWDLRTRTIATLTPDIIDLLVGFAAARPGPGAGIGLRPFHGAATRVGADDTAFGLRTRHVVVEISAGRQADEEASAYRGWADEVRTALEPHALPGGYPNFLLPDQHDQVAHAYGAHAPRLLAAKKRYDPEHVFTATPLPGVP
ncbi:FAD-binding oxidoreductase [Prauserella cavernicola]|uniref:FAD-binding oxidoreductase n=1 Tax=Prauserella cavernicola TaxID=2800127 RepID=A0A934QXT7_9PSEU|nr:FAD-binding oxidoreductase [Prauserella cavernicola]MBK1787253.1 FAD-binding oxidoreductase [Prauserella cavernicola]